MTDFERKTIDYLLTLQSEQEWQAWADTMDREGFERILDIIRLAQAENEIALMDLREGMVMQDLSEAQQVLSRY